MSSSEPDMDEMYSSEAESDQVLDFSESEVDESDTSDSDVMDTSGSSDMNSSDSEFDKHYYIMIKHPSQTTKRDTALLQLASRIKSIPAFPAGDFPSDVLKHMQQNATPQQALKLMLVNKCFLLKKFPFVFITNVGGTYLSTGDRVWAHWSFYKKKNGKFYERELKNETTNNLPDNLCFSGCLCLSYHDDLSSQLVSKAVACDLDDLTLNYVPVLYDEFNFFTSTQKLTTLCINRATVSYNNGDAVPYELLLDCSPLLKDMSLIYMPSLTLSPRFAERVLELNLEKLELGDFNDTFDFEAFLTSMKKKPKLCITVGFEKSDPVIEKINAYIDKIVAAGPAESCPPVFKIRYHGVSKERKDAMEKLRNDFCIRNGLPKL